MGGISKSVHSSPESQAHYSDLGMVCPESQAHYSDLGMACPESQAQYSDLGMACPKSRAQYSDLGMACLGFLANTPDQEKTRSVLNSQQTS